MIRVGQRLKEVRLSKNLTLEQVSQATKIKTAFLDAIEKGEYQKLPSSAYAQGFIRNYAQYLELPKREVLAFFRREFDEAEFYKVLPDGFSQKESFPTFRIKLHQSVAIGVISLILLCGYLVYQYRFAFINPPLEVYTPQDDIQITSRSIVVSGKTDPNATVYVNNEPAFLSENGEFKKQIDLFPGKSLIQIKAVNRFGKETKSERKVFINQ